MFSPHVYIIEIHSYCAAKLGKLMTKQTFDQIEAHMLSYMRDSAHDRHHIDRVLYSALDIVKHEENIDYDVLIASCLLVLSTHVRNFGLRPPCHAAWLLSDWSDSSLRYALVTDQSSEYSIR